VTGLTGVAVLGSTVITGLVVLLLTAVAAVHVGRTRREERDAGRRRALTPMLHDLLDGEGDHDRPDVTTAPAAFDEVVLQLLPQLRGADRKVLQDVLVSRGVVQRAASDLTARAAWRRGRAATLLGSTASTTHVTGLTALLGDRSPDVRSAAARALGKAGGPETVWDLLGSLTTNRALPRGVVGMAVLDLGTPVLPALREALVLGSPQARALSAELLGLHGDISALPALVTSLRDHGQPVEVHLATAVALGRIASPSATDALTAVFVIASLPVLRRAAAEALGRIGDPAASPVLRAGLDAPDPTIGAACADALAALGPEGRSLLAGLADGDDRASVAARGALDALAVQPRRLQTATA
jgi:HEAT repeat protein